MKETHDERSRIVSINQWNGGVAPRFYLGRTPGGTVCRFRDDVPDDLADQLLTLGNDEPLSNSFARMPSHHEEYLRLLVNTNPHAPAEFRCNGTLANLGSFAAAFDLDGQTTLMRNIEDRVAIW